MTRCLSVFAKKPVILRLSLFVMILFALWALPATIAHAAGTITTDAFVGDWGISDDDFNMPRGMTLVTGDGEAKLWVNDSENHKLKIFSLDLTLLRVVPWPGYYPPDYIDWDDEHDELRFDSARGVVYVAATNRIMVYSPKAELLRETTVTGGEFKNLSLAPNGDLWLSGHFNFDLRRVNPLTGALIKQCDADARGDGFGVMTDGTLVYGNGYEGQVKWMDPDTCSVDKTQELGAGTQGTSVFSVQVDPASQNVYVGYMGTAKVIVWNRNGETLDAFSAYDLESEPLGTLVGLFTDVVRSGCRYYTLDRSAPWDRLHRFIDTTCANGETYAFRATESASDFELSWRKGPSTVKTKILVGSTCATQITPDASHVKAYEGTSSKASYDTGSGRKCFVAFASDKEGQWARTASVWSAKRTITTFSVGSGFVQYGKAAPFRVRLRTAAGTSLAGRSVTVQRYADGTWKEYSKGSTDSAGVLSFKNKAVGRYGYRACFSGAPGYRSDCSKGVKLTAVRLSLSGRISGSYARLSGSYTVAPGGQPLVERRILLQKRTASGTWKTVRTLRTHNDGRYGALIKLSETTTYRAKVKGTSITSASEKLRL